MKKIAVLLVILPSVGYASCGYKDYQCIKQEYNRSKVASYDYAKRYNKSYNTNKKIYLHGKYNSSPIDLDSNHNRNVKIYANNTRVNSSDNTASLINLHPSSRHNYNNISLNVTGNIQNTATSIASTDTCSALVCNRDKNGTSGITVNIRNASISNTIK